MSKHSAIIIDDEKNIREALSVILEQYCPEVEVIGQISSAEEGRRFLERNNPDIVFLDISMPGEDGFLFLKSLGFYDFALIFITAHQEYALKALKINAVDYLLKPVNPFELMDAVNKALSYRELRRNRKEIREIYQESINNLQDQIFSRSSILQKITVTEQFGFKIVKLADLIYLEADQNYTVLHLKDNKQIIATKNLGEFEKMLEQTEFYRIHKSTIINLNFLTGYSSYQGNFAEMQDGSRLSISRRKVTEFREYIRTFFKSFE